MIFINYLVVENVVVEFYVCFCEFFVECKLIMIFGFYFFGQVVIMKCIGIEGIYFGGWVMLVKGFVQEDFGFDLVSYFLSQVLDEVVLIVWVLFMVDKSQYFVCLCMSEEQCVVIFEIDYCFFIIVDVDIGYGGEVYVCNFV